MVLAVGLKKLKLAAMFDLLSVSCDFIYSNLNMKLYEISVFV